MASTVNCTCGLRFDVPDSNCATTVYCPGCGAPVKVRATTYDIFVSHATEDRAIANLLCAALEQRGLSCWIAARDIPGGAKFPGQIVAAIESSGLLLLVFSAAANESDHVLNEVANAHRCGRPLLTVRLEDVRPSRDLAYFLGVPNWIDVASPPTKENLHRVSESAQWLIRQRRGPVDSLHLPSKSPINASPASDALTPRRAWFLGAACLAMACVGLFALLWTSTSRKPAGHPATPTAEDRAAQRAMVLFDQGVKLANEGDLDNAIKSFTDSLNLDPASADALLNRSRAYLVRGEGNNDRNDFLCGLNDAEQASKCSRHPRQRLFAQNFAEQARSLIIEFDSRSQADP